MPPLLAAVTLLVLGLELFGGIGRFPLQEPDEGRYADIAATMARTGDWLSPHQNGIPYYEKPPLFFWLAALSVKLLGPTEAAVRLPSCLASLATLLLVYALGRRVAGPRTGLLAAVILGSLPLFGLLCRITLVDLVLTACTTAALAAAWNVLVAGRDGERRSVLWFWAALALAFLAKGPVGVVLPVSGIAAFVLWHGEWRRARALMGGTGLLLFVVLAAPWYVFMAVRHPEFVREFFVEQNFQRLTSGGRFDREKPFHYYLVLLAAIFLPWARAVTGCVRETFRIGEGGRSLREDTRRFLLCAVVLPLLVLAAASSKLAYYLLPLLPPAALLLALAALAGSPAPRRRWARTAVALVPPAAIAVLWAMRALDLQLLALLEASSTGTSSPARMVLFADLAERLLPAMTVVCVGAGAVLAFLRWRTGPPGRDLVWGLGWCLLAALAPWVAAECAPLLSTKAVARAIELHRKPGEQVLFFGSYARCVPFYLQEPVTLWQAEHGEFGHEVTVEEAPGLALQRDPAELRRFLRSSPKTMVLVKGTANHQLALQLVSARLEPVAQAGEYLLLRLSSKAGREANAASD